MIIIIIINIIIICITVIVIITTIALKMCQFLLFFALVCYVYFLSRVKILYFLIPNHLDDHHDQARIVRDNLIEYLHLLSQTTEGC